MFKKILSNGTDSTDTLFRDVLMAALGSVMLVLMILIFFIGIQKKQEDTDRARGNIRVEIIWDNDTNVDVDGWVKGPGDFPVGYSNLNGRIFNLHRDDLGSTNDLAGINYEVMTSRGVPEGEWIVNLHWFSNAAGVENVPVKVIVSIRKDDSIKSNERPKEIMHKVVLLSQVGQEVTVVRFKTDKDKNILPNSVNNNFLPMRVKRSGHPDSGR